MNTPAHNRKFPWPVLVTTALISAMALVVARLRQTVPQSAPPPAVSAPAATIRTAVPPPPIPEHPLKRVRWLLFVSAALLVTFLMAALERPYAQLVMFGMLIWAFRAINLRTHALQRMKSWTQEKWQSRQVRWLLFVSACLLAGAGLVLLRRPYSTLVLVALAAVSGAAILHRVLPFVGALLHHLRWLIYILVVFAVGSILLTLEPPYNQWVVLALCAAAIPPILTRQRAASTLRDEVVGDIRGAALAALLLMIISAYAFKMATQDELRDPLLIFVLGVGAMALAVRLSLVARVDVPLTLPVVGQIALPETLTRWHKRVFWLGVILLVLLAEANGRALEIPVLVDMTTHIQFLLLVLGIALIVLGLSGIGVRQLRFSIDWRTVGLVLAITGLGLFLRFWQIDQGLRMFVDELNFASVAPDFWNIPNVRLLEPMSSIAAFPYIFPYFQAHAIDLFGRNLLGLRAVSAILGALTIPAAYLLGRTTFDRATGLIAALLLATFPPHLHFSRLGLNNIADPLFGTLALAFIARGLIRNRRFDYLLGGALLGLTHHFYEGGRLLYTPLVVAWLAGTLYLWRVRWRNLLLVAVTALLVALPIYYTLFSTNRPVAARLINNHTALSGEYFASLLHNPDELRANIELRVIYPFQMYFQTTEGSLFYASSEPFLLLLLVPAFFLGVGYVLSRLRQPGPLLLFLWVLAATLGQSLMVAADQAPRYVVVFPALMLLTAVGIRYTASLLWPGKCLRWPHIALLTMMVIGMAVFQIHFYFSDYLPTYNIQLRLSLGHRDAQDAVLRSLDFPPDTQIHIISQVPPDEGYTAGFMRFLTDDYNLDTLRPSDVTGQYLYELKRGVDHAFFVEVGRDEVLKRLRTYYYLLPEDYGPTYDDLPQVLQFPLYYAPYIPGYSDRLLEALDRLPRVRRGSVPW